MSLFRLVYAIVCAVNGNAHGPNSGAGSHVQDVLEMVDRREIEFSVETESPEVVTAWLVIFGISVHMDEPQVLLLLSLFIVGTPVLDGPLSVSWAEVRSKMRNKIP